ncbi:MAG: efflux RND transporter periplasmic adaptor subunit [Caldilineaceae bacterium]
MRPKRLRRYAAPKPNRLGSPAARTANFAAAAVAVTQAEAELARAQAKLDALTLTAPFAGTVTAVDINPGEMAQPGVVVLTLADLAHLQVETTDLSERDVARGRRSERRRADRSAVVHTVAGVVTQIQPPRLISSAATSSTPSRSNWTSSRAVCAGACPPTWTSAE